MNKVILILFVLLLTCGNSFGQETPEDGKKLGLVSYLTYVKSFSEFKMTSLITDKEYERQPDKAKKFNSDYNLLKLATDKLINQLSADLYSKNRLRLYKKLNQYLKGSIKSLPSTYIEYENLIKEIDDRLQTFMIRKFLGAELAGASIEEITGIIELGHGVITDARDFREKKIQSVTGLIKELKIVNISELMKSEEKKD